MYKKCDHIWVFDKLVSERLWRGAKYKHSIQYRCTVCGVTRISKPVNREFLPEEQEIGENGESASEQK